MTFQAPEWPARTGQWLVAVPPRLAARIGRIPAHIVRRVLYVICGFFALIILAWLILYVTKGRFLKHPFESIVGKQLEREVRVSGDFQLYFDPIDIKFLAEGMTISNPDWAEADNFFDAELINTRIAAIPLIFGHQRINWLELVKGDVALEWDGDGVQNTWTFGEPTGEPLTLPLIRYAAMRGSKLHYRDPKSTLSADIGFETISARDSAFENSIRFSGRGSARGENFTLGGGFYSPNATLAGGRNQFRLHAEGVRTVLDVSGVLPGLTELEGSNLNVQARGGNLANLFAFGGILVPDTRTYHLRSDLTKTGDDWRFTGMTGVFGDSDIGGTLTVATGGPRIKLTADIASDHADIIDLGPFIGYDPRALQRTGGAIYMVNGTPRVLPDAALRIDALALFDAHVDYRIRNVRWDLLPISNVALTLDLNNRLLALSPLEFDVSGGHLTSDIQINARESAVRTSYDIRLSPTPMGALLTNFGAEQNGTTGTIQARIQLIGTGDTIHESLANANGRIAIVMPRGSLVASNAQLAELDIGTFAQLMFEKRLRDPIQINCGLIAFTVRNGLAAADPILIDTRKNVITGKGGFSFRNEALDLAIEADGKDFSLFSGQSPVGVNGYFAAPGIDPISGELLARVGIGLGLGLIVSPLAAVVTFVDIGDAKAAACGPVLAGARARAQRTAGGDARHDVGDGHAEVDESGDDDDGGFLGLGIF